MKSVHGLTIALVFTALTACDSKTEAPVEPQAQAEPAALAKAPEAQPEQPKSHIRLSNVKTLVPLKKMDSKKYKAPSQEPIGEADEATESKAP